MKKYLLIGLAAALVLGWLVWEIRSRQAHRKRIAALEQQLSALQKEPAQPLSTYVNPYPDERAQATGDDPND